MGARTVKRSETDEYEILTHEIIKGIKVSEGEIMTWRLTHESYLKSCDSRTHACNEDFIWKQMVKDLTSFETMG